MSSVALRQINTPNAPRFYETPDGERYPSVTSILSVIAKPALLNWYAKVEREMVSEVAAQLYDDAPAEKMSKFAFLTTLERRLGKEKAAKKLLDKAGDIGSRIHEAAEWALRKELGQKQGEQPILTGAALWAFMAWEDWRSKTSLEPHYIEQKVYSRSYGYAGTVDLIATLNLPGLGHTLCVIDWKSGKAIYHEALIQIAAYRAAVVEMGHDQGLPMHGLVVRVPKTENDPAFEAVFVPSDELDKHFKTFLAARDLFVAVQAHEAARRASA